MLPPGNSPLSENVFLARLVPRVDVNKKEGILVSTVTDHLQLFDMSIVRGKWTHYRIAKWLFFREFCLGD